MSKRTFRAPGSRRDLPLSLLLGGAAAIGLFVVMALTQMIGSVEPPKSEITETMMAYVPPDIEVIEEEEPPPPEEEEEPPPELEDDVPELSLDQLDIALNPGTGGSLAGDFAMPTIRTSQADLGTEGFVDFSQLDRNPRPIGVTGFNFPRRLKKQKVSGKIVLLIKLSEEGEVMDVQIDQSNLPRFDAFVLEEVAGWRFTPPTMQGRPVKAQARLPIPINIR